MFFLHVPDYFPVRLDAAPTDTGPIISQRMFCRDPIEQDTTIIIVESLNFLRCAAFNDLISCLGLRSGFRRLTLARKIYKRFP